MSRRPFYEVPESAFLFGRKKGNPEEDVRQWALFELLSAYNVHISDIEIEKGIKFATRTHYADIVIKRSHVPYVVIECKRQENNDVEGGLKQAQDYADKIGAQFAVWTNGQTWLSRMKIKSWWHPVDDFPNMSVMSNGFGQVDFFISLAFFVGEVSPLLYWAYKPVPENQARKYIWFLQDFFHSLIVEQTFTVETDEYLFIGACDDASALLLNFFEEDADFHRDKLLNICYNMYEYFQKRGIRTFIESPEKEFEEGTKLANLSQNGELDFSRIIAIMFASLSRGDGHLKHSNDFIKDSIQLLLSLFAHLERSYVEREILSVPEILTGRVEQVIGSFCIDKLGIRTSGQMVGDYGDFEREIYKTFWDVPLKSYRRHNQPS